MNMMLLLLVGELIVVLLVRHNLLSHVTTNLVAVAVILLTYVAFATMPLILGASAGT